MSDLMSPETLFLPEHLAEFEKLRSVFYSQLVSVNECIYYVEQITAFPFETLGMLHIRPFFVMVVQSFLHEAVIGMTRIASDKGSDCLTIQAFKSSLLGMVVPEQSRAPESSQAGPPEHPCEASAYQSDCRQKLVHCAPSQGGCG